MLCVPSGIGLDDDDGARSWMTGEIAQRDNLLTERDERGACHLEARNPKRNPDDRDAKRDASEQVGERKPPAREDEPENVRERAQPTVSSLGGTNVRPKGQSA